MAEERNEERTSLQRAWLILLSAFLFAFFLACLFVAMRGILDLGGFVAKGGPYEIAHPAPSWVWVVPVSVVAIIMLMVFFLLTVGRRGPIDLLAALAWPAVFLSLGWNFLEYAFTGSQGVAWGWLVCGIVFVAMGGAPLVLIFMALRGSPLAEQMKENAWSMILQVAGIAIGIPCGYLFFRLVS